MKILVFGGTGFLGPHLVRQLASSGHDVRIFHRGEHMLTPLPPGVRKTNAELFALSTYKKALRAMNFDVIVHMIATHYEDARVVVDAFSGYAGRAVVASSIDVYNAFAALLGKEEPAGPPVPLDESAPLRTTERIYGDERERLDVEIAFRAEADRFPATILRLPFMYGPEDPRQRFFSHVKRFADDRPAVLLDPAFGNFRMTHAYVENVAHAFVRAIVTPQADEVPLRVFNVGESTTPTTAERLHALAHAAGYRGKVVVVPQERCPAHLVKSVNLRHDMVVDDRAIRRDLGYAEIVPAKEGYQRTIEWQRTVCPIPTDLSEFDYATEDILLRELRLV